jgi:hypothetical protein
LEKLQAASRKLQATSSKLQASGYKLWGRAKDEVALKEK